MGTRGLTGIKIGRQRKCTYNHFDSYPDGLGQKIVDFCGKIKDWDTFKENTKKVKLVDEDSKPTIDEQHKYRRFHDSSISTGKITEWYSLLRNLQGVSILEQIYFGHVEHMINSNNFINDSLFCEYAYIINLNTMKLEMYEGFQKTGKKKIVKTPNGTFEQNEYAPCKKVAEFPLNDIPENWKEIAFPRDGEDE